MNCFQEQEITGKPYYLTMDAPVICKNCGAGFSGNYCNQCGEKVYTHHHKKLSHVVNEVFHFSTHLDSKFVKTLWLYFSRPGFVSKEYCEGKRIKYFKPVSLFLVSVVIYLLFPLLQGMNISFSSHIGNNKGMGIQYSIKWARQKMIRKHLTEYELAASFNQASPKFAKGLLLLLLPLSALSLQLIFWKKRKFFFDHFVLSTEFNTFFLLSNFMVLPLLVMAISAVLPFQISYGDNMYFGSLIGLIMMTFVNISFRRFYGVSFFESLVKSILFLLSFILILFIYRQITFMLVMLFI